MHSLYASFWTGNQGSPKALQTLHALHPKAMPTTMTCFKHSLTHQIPLTEELLVDEILQQQQQNKEQER